MIDNRELAGAMWLGVVIAYCLVRPTTRSSARDLLAAALHRKIVVPVLLMLALVLALVWMAAEVGLWVSDLLVPTTIWFLASGLVLLFNFQNTSESSTFLRSTAGKVLGVGVGVAFFTNLFTLSLLGELVLQPVIVFLTLLAVAARLDPAHRAVERLAEAMLGAIGAALIAYSAVQLARRWDSLDLRLLSLELLLPVWLTAGVLPFVYAMAFYGAYEQAFVYINRAVGCRRGRRRVKLATLLSCRLHLGDVGAFNFYWARRAGEAATLADTRRQVDEYRQSRREAEHEEAEARRRLDRNAGLQGADDEGRRLDQREFDETKDALQWLATCQMGQYRNRGGRYRPEMLEVLGDFAERCGLPVEHGIELHVSPDGQSWWAGRRTVTGWCFAIGAAGPPPDQWSYDGPDLPGGLPGDHPDWGDDPFSVDACANW